MPDRRVTICILPCRLLHLRRCDLAAWGDPVNAPVAACH